MIDREVRDATDLYALASQYVTLQRRGNIATAPCPFHKERTASFRVNVSGRYAGRFHCFGCGVKGDSIDFLSAIEGITKFEAIKRLAADAGISVSGPSESTAERSQRREDQRRSIWWRRDRWQRQRRALDSLLASGPPEPGSAEYSRAEYHGQLMRYLESGGKAVFTESDLRRYRQDMRRQGLIAMQVARALATEEIPPAGSSKILARILKNL